MNEIVTHAGHGASPLAASVQGSEIDRARDPICGMMVDKATALHTERSYYFCSAGCQRTFESPEQELKSMRTRVAVAMTGVLALPIRRRRSACAA